MKTTSHAPASRRAAALRQPHRRAAIVKPLPMPKPDPQTARALKAIKGLKGII